MLLQNVTNCIEFKFVLLKSKKNVLFTKFKYKIPTSKYELTCFPILRASFKIKWRLCFYSENIDNTSATLFREKIFTEFQYFQ